MSDEYISREAALPDVCCNGKSCQECLFLKHPVYGGCELSDFIFSIPAADVKPAAHASWVQDDEIIGGDIWRKWRCDECGYIRTQGWKHTKDGEKPQANICENCGADMTKEVNDE